MSSKDPTVSSTKRLLKQNTTKPQDSYCLYPQIYTLLFITQIMLNFII